MFASTRSFRVAASVLSYASRSALSNQINILQLKTTRSCSILSRLRSSSSIKVLGAKKIDIYSKTCSCAIHHKLTEGKECFSARYIAVSQQRMEYIFP